MFSTYSIPPADYCTSLSDDENIFPCTCIIQIAAHRLSSADERAAHTTSCLINCKKYQMYVGTCIGNGNFKCVRYANLNTQSPSLKKAKKCALAIFSCQQKSKLIAREQFILERLKILFSKQQRGLMLYIAGCSLVSHEKNLHEAFLLPFYNCGSLADKRYSISVANNFKVALDICIGLKSLHDNKIVHNDLGPDNICVHSKKNGEICAYIIDFGLASDLASEDHQIPLAANVKTCSPELKKMIKNRSGKITPKSDIYSLATILQTLLGPRLAILDNMKAKDPAKRPNIDEVISYLSLDKNYQDFEASLTEFSCF